jgi:N-acyl-L-homoserine lactone synthetase
MPELAFSYNGFIVKTLDTPEERGQGACLRHRVFAERLKWIPVRPDGLDRDTYDAYSSSIGVFTAPSQLLGVVRLTPTPGPFMLEREFSACLAGTHLIRKAPDTVEISRLAVDPSVTKRGLSTQIVETIFEGMYQWGLLHGVRYAYMVSDRRFVRVVQRLGWPVVQVGRPLTLPPAHVCSIAALLDIHQSARYKGLKEMV